MREFVCGGWKISAAAECGGNLACVRWQGRDIMRGFVNAGQWQTAPTDYGFPILFPPNRIADGVFRFRNREYRLPVNEIDRHNHLHGIALREKWKFGECGADSVNMFLEFGKNSPWYADYPCDCKLAVTYTLTERVLTQELQIENRADTVIPCALGVHSAFAAPEKVLVHGRNGRIEILPPRYLASGREVNWLPDGFSPGKWCMPDKVYPFGHFRMDETHLAELDCGDFKLEYVTDEKFDHWMVWRPENDTSFLCIEPMNIRVGCFENTPELLPFLEPGESRKFTSRIKIIC